MKLGIIAFFSSILSAMGIGGGTVYIAAASLVEDLGQQIFQLQNLVIFIFAAGLASFRNIHQKIFDKKLFFKLIIFGIIGCIIGAIIATKISDQNLKKYFYVFMLVTAIYEIISSIILKLKGNNKSAGEKE